MAKADKTVAFRPSVEVWELLQKEKSYSEVIEIALKRYYGLEAGEGDSLGKSEGVSEGAIASVVEERLEKYHASLENALEGIYQRLEAVEAAPANLDADLVQKDLATTAHSDDPIPPQPQPPVLPRKTDTDGGEWITATELGKRLGLSDGSALTKQRTDPEKLADYTRDRDPDGIAWQWNGKQGKVAKYAPVGS